LEHRHEALDGDLRHHPIQLDLFHDADHGADHHPIQAHDDLANCKEQTP
jgi:hypothetical protein